MKRFKKNPADQALASSEITDVKNMPNAKEVFRRMTNQTQYGQQFGARPKELQDHKVLNKTPFVKLAISQVLKPDISQMLNRWLAMNDQDKFNERVFVTVREMYTLVKNLLADVPTSQDIHSNHIELEATPPRFDKILLAQSEQRRLKSMGDPILASEIRGRRKKSYYAAVDYKLGSRHRDPDNYRLDPNNIYQGPTMIETKSFKQQFLAGDKRAVMYTNPNEPKTSSYQTTLRGIQVDGDVRATILDR